MNRRTILAAAPVLAVAGCAADVSAVAATLSGQDATSLWGIALGMAEQVAEASVPGLPALLAAAKAVVPALLTAIGAGTATAQDVATVVTQAGKVTLAAAPAIKVVSNA